MVKRTRAVSKPGSVPERFFQAMAIPLGLMLPPASSDLPESIEDGQSLEKNISPALLFGLAPDGVCQAIPVTRNTGKLLPHLFTLTLQWILQSGIFSAALSLRLLPVAVSDRPALRSPDFPPECQKTFQRPF